MHEWQVIQRLRQDDIVHTRRTLLTGRLDVGVKMHRIHEHDIVLKTQGDLFRGSADVQDQFSPVFLFPPVRSDEDDLAVTVRDLTPDWSLQS